MSRNLTLGIIGVVIFVIGLLIITQVELAPEFKEKTSTGANGVENLKNEIIVPEEFLIPPREWVRSGPFQVNKSEYRLGEKIFVMVEGLAPIEKGQIAFLRPVNETHYKEHVTIPFDGSKKSSFNQYLEIELSKHLGICNREDLIGSWIVIFQGTSYENISFKVINETIPRGESSFLPVC